MFHFFNVSGLIIFYFFTCEYVFCCPFNVCWFRKRIFSAPPGRDDFPLERGIVQGRQVMECEEIGSLETRARDGSEKHWVGTLIHRLKVWWDMYCLLFHLVLMIAWSISMLPVPNVFRAASLAYQLRNLHCESCLWISMMFLPTVPWLNSPPRS